MNGRKMGYWGAFSACLILSLIILTAFFQPAGAQPNPNRIGLVVQFKDGRVVQTCVEVSQAEVTGFEVLTNSGLTFTADFDPWLGASICKIENEGCAADNCFCEMPNYWSYWHIDPAAGGSAWRYSNIGSSSYKVRAGAVEGWHYGETGPPTVKPSFEEICSDAAPTATTAKNEPPAAPTAPVFIPTSPPRWATAIIIGPTMTIPPTTAPTDQAQPPPAVETPAQGPSNMTQELQPGVENQTEATPPGETPAPPTDMPSPTPPPSETPTEPPLRASSRAATQLALIEPQPVPLEGEVQQPADDQTPGAAVVSPAARLTLVLGGLAGLSAFAGFALLLLGALVIVYLLRKQ